MHDNKSVGDHVTALSYQSAAMTTDLNWELPWQLGAQWSRTSTLPTQWRLHAAAFYDRLAFRMCLCRVALSCSHCDVNQTLQIRRIGYRSGVALSFPMLQITVDVQSDIIISLTLVYWFK